MAKGTRGLPRLRASWSTTTFTFDMEADPSSYLPRQPTWKPFLPAATNGDYTMGDLIVFSGHGLGQT